MNKTQSINLGNKPFIINDDAYFKLSDYLIAVKNQFASSGGADEIMTDIEMRIAELFDEKQVDIINMTHVDEMIHVMGTPDDFKDTSDSYEEEYDDNEYDDPTTSSTAFSPGKKLFRDTDNKMIAGVCSGLSEYVGIKDPVWMRIIFVLLVVGGFSGVIVYLIMWAVVPEARTASDRLKMKGKKIDISSIADDIEREFKDLSGMVSDFSKDFDWKKGRKKDKV